MRIHLILGLAPRVHRRKRIAAYWFTASTSFANPAVTVARSLSDTYAGIAPEDAPGFLAAQIVGAGVAVAVSAWLWRASPAAGAQL